ncbi:hypothetical protein OOT00_06745 [Desulfobotulus sp. H1]|uniref:Electron transfer flavoprotein alpha/beta-subunit N-terminal domain-containing protein n=1 Tax=Desulfobotulus pelophilus TaxID=2823377 RepID=A0ABT3N897_9BACT|nr:hypothetical protein [Desulfobotulus pelophilus]MCW7753681.1 hypothetical protein [Desulfobotulus pelophilus]
MHIAVCVKATSDRLPDPGPESEIGKEDALRMSDWDSVAMEAGLRLRDARGSGKVTIITAGPESWNCVLQRGMGMGADAALRVHHFPSMTGPGETAGALAFAIGSIQPDLVICGAMGEEGMQAAIGPMLAAACDLPFAAMVVAVDCRTNGICVSSEGSGGRRLRYSLPFPCLVTVQTGLYTPRYPKLSLMLKADQSVIPVMTPSMNEYPSASLQEISLPSPSRSVHFLTGDTRAKAASLKAILKERGWLAVSPARGDQ